MGAGAGILYKYLNYNNVTTVKNGYAIGYTFWWARARESLFSSLFKSTSYK
jgi:hypothetical protein